MDKIIELKITDFEFEQEAEAAVENPFISWAKATITDDLPNLNSHRIPIEEFENMIRTGKLAPVKMAEGGISMGHKEAYGKPIGTIANLKTNGNRLEALIALWKKERPEDIDHLKAMANSGILPQLSWEIAYDEAIPTETGFTDLHGVILNGVAVVALPAYGGRTAMTAIASVDQNMEENKLEKELEELKVQLEEKLARIVELETKLTEKEAELLQKNEELSAISAEKEALAQFKQEVESEKLASEKLAGIQQKFSDSKIEKPEKYFVDNRDRLLKMSDEELDFLLQELVSFASEIEEASIKVPNFHGGNHNISARELGRKLREERNH